MKAVLELIAAVSARAILSAGSMAAQSTWASLAITLARPISSPCSSIHPVQVVAWSVKPSPALSRFARECHKSWWWWQRLQSYNWWYYKNIILHINNSWYLINQTNLNILNGNTKTTILFFFIKSHVGKFFQCSEPCQPASRASEHKRAQRWSRILPWQVPVMSFSHKILSALSTCKTLYLYVLHFSSPASFHQHFAH